MENTIFYEIRCTSEKKSSGFGTLSCGKESGSGAYIRFCKECWEQTAGEDFCFDLSVWKKKQ